MAAILSATLACTGHLLPDPAKEKPMRDSQFIIVTARANDTFQSLARRYLKDEDQGWRIAAYNRTDAIKAGQRLVIPRVPIRHGGLTIDGYQTVPVLVYLDMAQTARRTETVSLRSFERQLKYLRDNGYTPISLDQFHAFLNLRGDIPPHAVVISMDTTRRWAFDVAYRALKQFDMKAALFFDVDRIGRKGYLTWKQLAEMAANGIDLGVYGQPLKAPAKESLADYLKTYEAGMTRPRKTVPEKVNAPCRYYAFTSGKSDDLTVSLLKKHGYRGAFTRQRGSNPFFIDHFMIKRSVIYGHYDMQKFRRNLVTFRTMELK